MKKLILALVLCIPLFSQPVRFDPQPAATVSSNVPPGALTPVLAIPGATITLCGYPVTGGTPCTNKVTTYTSITGLAPCPVSKQVTASNGSTCTALADGQGNFGWYVFPGTYAYEITYQGTTHGPFVISVSGGGGGGGSGISALNGDVSATGPGTAAATVLGIRNSVIPSLVAGNLKYNGFAFVFDAASYLTGNQNITFTASGDVTGTSSGPTSLTPILTTVGIRGSSIPALSTGFLKYTGLNWIFDPTSYVPASSIPPSQPCLGSNATGGIIAGTCSGGTAGINQLTGDVTAGPGTGSQVATVVKVNGAVVPISQTCLGSNGTGQLIPGTCSGGTPAFSAITSGTNTTANMSVGTGGALFPVGTGIIRATDLVNLATTSSTTTINVGSLCSGTNPCNVHMGNAVYSFTTPASFVLTGGTGQAYVYVSSSGTLTAGYSSITLGSCSLITCTSGITAFPLDSWPVAIWSATGGAWTSALDTRTFAGRDIVVNGTGILSSVAPPGVKNFTPDPAVVLFHSTVAGTGSVLCTDASQKATTVGCSGSSYTAPGSGASTIPIATQLTAATLNGINYGMACDGVTDDSPALQNAINALSIAAPQGPARLQLPSGICVMKSGVSTASSNFDIYGAGTTLRAFGNPIPVSRISDGAAVPYLLSFTGSHIGLHNFALDGNSANWGLAAHIALYNNAKTYYPTGAPGFGGGGDTVAIVSGDLITVYACKLQTIGHTPPNATYWTQIDQFTSHAQATFISGGGTNAGFLIQYANGSSLRLDNMEMMGGSFGLYIYATTSPVTDIVVNNLYCHDFNIQPDFGNNNNNLNMDCIHGYSSGTSTPIRGVRITNSFFKNIYVPDAVIPGTPPTIVPTGPGPSVSAFMDASDVVFSNNHIENVIQTGGGVGAIAAVAANSQWVISNNIFYKNITINNDKSDAVELEGSNITVTGNSVFGFNQCMSQTNLPPANVGLNTFTGNTCQGNGTGNGIVITESGTSSGDSINTVITGNTFFNYLYGVWIDVSSGGATPAVNVTVSGNSYQSMITGPLWDPSNATGWIWNTYPPTVSLTSYVPTGSLSTQGQYKRDGKTITVQATPTGTITGNYTSATLTVAMPAPAAFNQFIPVQVAASGCTGISTPQGFIPGGSSTLSVLFNATCAGTQNVFIFASGTYQSQ